MAFSVSDGIWSSRCTLAQTTSATPVKFLGSDPRRVAISFNYTTPNSPQRGVIYLGDQQKGIVIDLQNANGPKDELYIFRRNEYGEAVTNEVWISEVGLLLSVFIVEVLNGPL